MEGLFPDEPRPGDPTYIEVRNIAEDELNELIDISTSRKEIIDRHGRPLRYREHEISYESCDRKTCNELILKFSTEDVITSFRETLQQLPPDQTKEDMNLRKLGKQGDSIAQKLWEQSITYYSSQQKDIVKERNENERKQIIKIKELEANLKIRAEAGEPKEQFELYMLGDKTDSKWLCRSADQSYTKAEMWLGYVLETGTYGFPLDNTKSYVWYRRTAIGEYQQEIEDLIKQIKEESPKLFICKGIACDIAQNIIDLEGKLGTEGLNKAESMLEQWKPGQCEKQFVRADPNT